MISYPIKSTVLTALSAALLLAGGCARDTRPIYTESDEVKLIEVPPDLTAPDTTRAFHIPGISLPELAGARDESRPPRVLPSADVESARSRVRFGPRGLYLEVDDEKASVWRRLGFSLNRGDMSVLEVQSQRDRYRFRFNDDPTVQRRTGLARLAVWRRARVIDYSGDYLIELEADGERTRVHLMDNAGGVVGMEQAEHVLVSLQERLG